MRALAASFSYAARGVAACLWQERNFRIHLIAAGYAAALGLWMKLSRLEWAALALTVGMVLALELVNTAVESAIDLANPDVHPLAALAKDAAAGAVLLAAAAAVGVGICLFWRPARLGALLEFLLTSPIAFAMAVLSLVLSYLFIFRLGLPKDRRPR